MDYSTGKISFLFIVAVVLSFMGAWWVAYRYRVAMRRLMSAPAQAARRPAGEAVRVPSPTTPAVPVTASDNRRAGMLLGLLLVGLSVLMATSLAALELGVVMEPGAFSWKRLAVLALVHVWPVFPALVLVALLCLGSATRAVAPWLLPPFILLAWWPLKRLARALARAYAAKRLSELLVLFTAV